MSIIKLKEAEDLKTIKEKLSDDIVASIKIEKSNILKKTKVDFREYFISRGFKVVDINSGTTASYGQQVVTILFPEPTSAFLGAFTVMDLILTGTIKKQFTVAVYKIEDESNNSISYRNTHITAKDNLDEVIAKLKEDIDQLKIRRDGIREIKLGYRVYEKDEATKNPSSKFTTSKKSTDFKELLDLIFS